MQCWGVCWETGLMWWQMRVRGKQGFGRPPCELRGQRWWIILQFWLKGTWPVAARMQMDAGISLRAHVRIRKRILTCYISSGEHFNGTHRRPEQVLTTMRTWRLGGFLCRLTAWRRDCNCDHVDLRKPRDGHVRRSCRRWTRSKL